MLPRPTLSALLLPALLLVAACRPPAAPAPVESQWAVMSTVASLSLPADTDAARRTAAQQSVSNAFRQVERQFSVFLPESDLARINGAAGGPEQALAADTAGLLRRALQVAAESGGAFDPTVGPLMRLWGFRGTNGPPRALPDDAALAAARQLVGWSNVLLRVTDDPAAPCFARLRLAGSQLDLGGIAKGYAVDLAYDRLMADGQHAFLVNLAGNLRVTGRAAADRAGWRVGVRDPFDADGRVGTLHLTNGEAVATSGHYERFVVIGGRRYAHIMDPRSGRPVQGMAGVTVLAPTALEADALSTTLFVLGAEAGVRLLAQHPGCEALFIPDEQPPRLLATPGMLTRFTPREGARTRLQVLRVE